MAFMKNMGDSFAVDIIKSNSGKTVRIVDKGVCVVLDSDRSGVFAHTSEGYFWVAKADRDNPYGWCIEIDPSSVSQAKGKPDHCFTVTFRSWLPTNSMGIKTGGYEMGEWITPITLVARTPNVLKMLQNLQQT